jgi:D-beta-D-heptose 7-phosphate kinase / D-beta-D-heptose 1-phosphate adenosyltransferase
VTLVSGCFDGLHIGHIQYFRQAKALGNYATLAVAVAPDAYIRQHKQREPHMGLWDRLQLVYALSCVDRVVAHDASGVAATILDLKPRYFIKGIDWRDQLPETVLAACQLVGCQVRFVDSGSTVHSRDLSPV